MNHDDNLSRSHQLSKEIDDRESELNDIIAQYDVLPIINGNRAGIVEHIDPLNKEAKVIYHDGISEYISFNKLAEICS